MFRRRVALSVFFLTACISLVQPFAVAGAAEAGRCDWSPKFWAGDLSDDPTALAVFDDGNGPALYAAGSFDNASDVPVAGIARWDGDSWTSLVSTSGFGIDGIALALAVYDDGAGDALYVGGDFASAGGVPVHNLARWDGSTWSPVAGIVTDGVDGEIYALTTFDDGTRFVLVAGGSFQAAGGVAANNVARWSADGWSPLAGPGGNGTNDYVEALAVHDDGSGPGLYAGGRFTTAGDLLVNNVARWDSDGWSALGGAPVGVSGRVCTLASYAGGGKTGLYVGGGFQQAGGLDASNIAVWRHGAWSPVDGGVSGALVHAMAVFNDGSGKALYVGGRFDAAGSVAADGIARWDGTTWTSPPGFNVLDNGSVEATVFTLQVYDDGEAARLYAGGRFFAAGDTAVNRIASWHGASWSRLDPRPWHGLSWGGLRANGAGGELMVTRPLTAGTVITQRMARWNGVNWAPLGGPNGIGIIGWPTVLEWYAGTGDSALYVGGSFDVAGGVPVEDIASWDGTEWSDVTGSSGVGLDGQVAALRVYDNGAGSLLYAGGWFENAGGLPADGLARWDGLEWSPLPDPGYSGPALRLEVYDDGNGAGLYVIGDNLQVGGTPAPSNTMRWDGATWTAVLGEDGLGLSGDVDATAVFDDGGGEALYMARRDPPCGGSTSGRIARWDGISCTVVPGDFEQNADLTSLVAADVGNGPRLYLGGWFTTIDGVVMNSIAAWDGNDWAPLAGPNDVGVDGGVEGLAAFDDGHGQALFVIGDFSRAGGQPSVGIARWGLNPIFFDGFESGDTSAWSSP